MSDVRTSEASAPRAQAAARGEETAQRPALRSVHTASFARILAETNSSVLVTTYQAGKLIILRNDLNASGERGFKTGSEKGTVPTSLRPVPSSPSVGELGQSAPVLNTHFRDFARPMGLAVSRGKLAIGTRVDIQEFHDVPAVCERLDAAEESDEKRDGTRLSGALPPPQPSPQGGVSRTREREETPFAETRPRVHDACFLPRRSHTTGDVQIHEMAWIGDELWFVNTAFSCLSTRSDRNSFEVRWRPSFIDKLIPGDCCHLNGLAVRDGRVAYVTALGTTSEPGGWRANKRNGGILIDVQSNEIIAQGLSMPHSPRWYRNQLWLLQSGDGSLGTMDLSTGRYDPIVQLPGFTRGLSFLGPLAFVGLSQVRESATFSGIPLVDRLQQSERVCGVWVVNIETGEILAFVRFEDAVQEIFAVEVLAGIGYPDLINHDPELIGRSYVLSDDALALVPEDYKLSTTVR